MTRMSKGLLVRVCVRVRLRIRAHVRVRVRALMRLCVLVQVRMCMCYCACVCACASACACADVHELPGRRHRARAPYVEWIVWRALSRADSAHAAAAAHAHWSSIGRRACAGSNAPLTPASILQINTNHQRTNVCSINIRTNAQLRTNTHKH